MINKIRVFYRYMIFYKKGVIYVSHTGQEIYISTTRKHKDDVMLAVYTGQAQLQDLLCDILREFREHIYIDNVRKHRDTYLKAALGYIYDTLYSETKEMYPHIKIGGGFYERKRWER